jgi:glycosyltransferase involved in cell wall biosynthesis
LTLKLFCGAHHIFYLGDIPADTRPNRALCRVANWMADAIIVNSQAVKRGLENLGIASGRVEVVYNGVVLDRFRNAQPFAWREQFGWDKDVLVVGYAGQFAPNKGVSDFLRAAERVLEETDRCRFVLVGQRDDENACYRQLVERISLKYLGDKIVFAGWTTAMERADAAMNLVIVPSRHEEPASNVIIEAMASGVPVIATRTGGSPELIANGTTGFLVEKQNPEEIAEKILLLTNDRSLLEALGESARKQALERFDAARNASQIEKVILSGVK